MEEYIFLFIALGIIAFFAIQSFIYKDKEKKRIDKLIRENWGKITKREYSYNEFERISHYYNNVKEENEFSIDDITWNDLDMDRVFMMLNQTNSSIGEEFLYKLLRIPAKSNEELLRRDSAIEFFMNDKETSIEFKKKYFNIGRSKSISMYDFLQNINDIADRTSLKHYLMCTFLIVSIISMFVYPPIGILLLVTSISINVLQYYKVKAEIDSYFICFKYLVSMLVNSKSIIKLIEKTDNDTLSDIKEPLIKATKVLKPLERNMFLLASNQMSGSLVDIIMDYIRILFHVDLIKFNSMLKLTISNTDSVLALYENLGEVEAFLNIANYRLSLTNYTKPNLYEGENKGVDILDVYHPLIEEPVKNSIKENKSVLLTGSNASGKSTFLKTVAINVLFSQTIYTVLAKEYKGAFYEVYTSMALKDNLENNESYYIVEIKSLKRITDKMNNINNKICFVDEVLRGTNTVERIAASSQILKKLSESKVFCFAATHDIELTHILEDSFSNYHFQEEVLKDTINFDYVLYKGRAVSRNAIKLLEIMGYDKDIVKKAEDMALDFVTNGKWKSLKI